nr:hypothetical protein [Candidatus Njordarchaeota archaeon]
MPVKGRSYTSLAGSIAYDLDIEDIRKGFFMDLIVLPEMTFVELAFDGEESQLCYRGLVAIDNPMVQVPIISNLQTTRLSAFSFLAPEYANMSFTELNQLLRVDYQTSVEIYKNLSPRLFATDDAGTAYLGYTPYISHKRYGIAHEQADLAPSLAERLPADYWVSYTAIDVGIYRRSPGRAQRKSALQYYNKDFMRNE